MGGRGMLEERGAAMRLVYTLLLVLAGILVFSALGFGMAFAIYGTSALNATLPQEGAADPTGTQSLKIIQLFSSIGTFIAPAIAAGYLFSPSWKRYLRWERVDRSQWVVGAAVLMLLMIPVINYLGYWNQAVELPNALKPVEDWMREIEASNQVLMERLLHMDHIGDYLFNLLLVAIVPAIGEELLFRGVVQKELIKWTKSQHVGIWLSAIVFSAIHFQFLGFVPRALMGALFGYVLVYTGSIRLPILMHFINNAVALTLVYLGDQSFVDPVLEDPEFMKDQWPLVLLCAAGAGGLLFWFQRSAKKKEADHSTSFYQNN